MEANYETVKLTLQQQAVMELKIQAALQAQGQNSNNEPLKSDRKDAFSEAFDDIFYKEEQRVVLPDSNPFDSSPPKSEMEKEEPSSPGDINSVTPRPRQYPGKRRNSIVVAQHRASIAGLDDTMMEALRQMGTDNGDRRSSIRDMLTDSSPYGELSAKSTTSSGGNSLYFSKALEDSILASNGIPSSNNATNSNGIPSYPGMVTNSIDFVELMSRPKDQKEAVGEHRAIEVIERVVVALLETHGSWLEAFSAMDNRNMGRIPIQDFVAYVRNMNLGLTEVEINALVAAIDEDGNGDVDYAEFKALEEFLKDDNSDRIELKFNIKKKKAKEVELLLTRLRIQLFKKYPNLNDCFDEFDRNRDARLSVAEMVFGFRTKLGIQISEAHMEEILLLVSRENFCNRVQFQALFSNAPKPRPTEDIRPLKISLAVALRREFTSLTTAFEFFDTSGKGKVTLSDFVRGVSRLVPEISETQSIALARLCGLERDGLPFDGFVKAFIRKLKNQPSQSHLQVLSNAASSPPPESQPRSVSSLSYFQSSSSPLNSLQPLAPINCTDKQNAASSLGVLPFSLSSNMISSPNGSLSLPLGRSPSPLMTLKRSPIPLSQPNRDSPYLQHISAAAPISRKSPLMPLAPMPESLKQLRDALVKHIRTNFASVNDAFQAMNELGKGTLDRSRFGKALRNTGLQINDINAIQLFKAIDGNGDERIDRVEFERFVASQQYTMHEDWPIPRLLEEISADLKIKHKSLQLSFHAFDTNGDGKISVEEFAAGLGNLNIKLSQDKILHLIAMGSGRSNSVDIDFVSFIKMFSLGNNKKLLTKFRGNVR